MSEDASKGEVLYYVYGNGLISQTDRSGRTLVYHYDYRGSTTSLTDKAGRAAAAYSYDTYGGCSTLELPAGTTCDTIFRFCGRDGAAADSSGLYYMRIRCYSSELMRFLNADTYTGSIAESATLNRYAYANGDPVSYTDPYGMSAEYAKLSERGHLALDMLSLILAAGNVFDLVNGVWYAAEYDAGGAALSAVSAIPAIGMIGNVIKVGKDAAKGAKLAEKAAVKAENILASSVAKRAANTSKINWLHKQYVYNLSDMQIILEVKCSPKGISTLGSTKRKNAVSAGKAWVGENYNIIKDNAGNIIGFSSEDGMRAFRMQYKTKEEMWRANFQENIMVNDIFPNKGQHSSQLRNVHIDIID